MDKEHKAKPAKNGRVKKTPEEKKQQLAEALKQNLRRRKEADKRK